MLERQYWGKSGQYGPFTAQADGWPNRGEVIRTYRKQKKMSAAKLGELYGLEIDGQAIKERWIQAMEKENTVPQNEMRRRVLATILGIPPILLGLGSMKDLLPEEQSSTNTVKAFYLSENAKDLSQYEKYVSLLWKLDYTSSAKDELRDIEKNIEDLRALASTIKSSLRTKALELLNAFYPLASTIYTDQHNYSKGLEHAENGLKLATNLENNRLIALAQYQRGWVKLFKGIMTSNQETLCDAIADFEMARPLASPQVEASLLLDMGWAYSLRKDIGKTMIAIDAAQKIVSRGDIYDNTFMDVYSNINPGKVYLGRVIALVGAKRYHQAGEELEIAEELVSHDHTRRRAYVDMLWARVYLGEKMYPLAAEYALYALAKSKSINSTATMVMLKDIHTQLMNSNFRNSLQVKKLGIALILP